MLVRRGTVLWLGLAALSAYGADIVERALPTWQRIDNSPPVIGADGLSHSASCSAYPGSDPSFRFWARPGRVNKLLVYFEGGGACWDSATCTYPFGARLPDTVPQYYVPSAPQLAPRPATGVFDTRADNPVRDWSVVYIPYCSGDTHVGANQFLLGLVQERVVDLPAGNEERADVGVEDLGRLAECTFELVERFREESHDGEQV